MGEWHERVLVGALGPTGTVEVHRDRLLEHAEPMPAARADHRRGGVGGVEEPAELGLPDHARELMRREHVGEVDERARNRRHGNPVVHRDVTRVEPARQVQPDPLLGPALTRDDDVDQPVVVA